MNDARSFFDALDKKIESYIDAAHAEEGLINLYSELVQDFRERIGTGAGITGLSEYVFFHYIRRALEVKTGRTLIAHPVKEIRIFENEKLLLTHDIDIKRFLIDANKQKTDIAVFEKGIEDKIRLLAAFEIKAYITDPRTLKDLFYRLDNLAEKTEALLFPIVCSMSYANEFEAFCCRHPGRAFLISGTDHKFRISISEAIDKIVAQVAT